MDTPALHAPPQAPRSAAAGALPAPGPRTASPRARWRTAWPLVLAAATALLFLFDILLGPVDIAPEDILRTLAGGDAGSSADTRIITRIRLPKALTALLAGGALAVAGLLMQTLFRNPLAGPEVLGITSGASLGVALVLLTSGFAPGAEALQRAGLLGGGLLVAAASLGSALVLLLVLAVSCRVRDNASLMIIGLMMGTLTVSLVSLLLYLSTPEQMQDYLMWTFGSLGGVSGPRLTMLASVAAVGILLALAASKPLDLLLLGETYARSLGLSVRGSRVLVIAATSILAGGVTAFCGPIGFVGLAVPHLARALLGTSGHLRLILASCLLGGMVLLLCDIVSQLPGNSFLMPVNVLTALVGAPVVIGVVVRARHRRNPF